MKPSTSPRLKHVLWKLSRSAAGAFDLPSILVGVVVVGILTAGVLASLFAIIPVAQEKNAQQDLGAIRTAEGVAMAKDSGFLNKQGLVDASYINGGTNIAVETNPERSCYLGLSKAGTGKIFYSDDKDTNARELIAGASVNCLTAPQLDTLIAQVGGYRNFDWKGSSWQKRYWDGAPHFNRDFDAANVSDPDANGYVKLSITNPTGSAPVAAEFRSTREGFGYGTYSTTVEKNVSTLQKEVVWGCLFTYDQNAAPGYTEIDMCEASAWGGGAAYGESRPVKQGHGYWFDDTKAAEEGNNITSFLAPTSEILTHKMVWSSGKIVFETYEGTGFSGTLLKRTVLESPTVPVPAKERVHFNLWVTGGGGGDSAHVKPESVIIRDFSFTPE